MAWMRKEKKKESVGSFYRRRLLSIIPGYYLIIILSFILNYLLFHTVGGDIGFARNRSPLAILCNLLLVHGLVPFANNDVAPGGWFIGTLMIFYLLLPILYKMFFRNKNIGRIFIFGWQMFVIAIAIMLVWIFRTTDIVQNNTFFYYSFVVQLPSFMLGILLCCNDVILCNTTKCIECYIKVILLFTISLFLLYVSGIYHAILQPIIVGGVAYYSLKLLITKEEKGKLKNNYLINFLCKFGQRSYYIYLVHGFFVWTMPTIIAELGKTYQVDFAKKYVYIILLPFMFILSYYCAGICEKQCMKVIKYFEKLNS